MSCLLSDIAKAVFVAEMLLAGSALLFFALLIWASRQSPKP